MPKRKVKQADPAGRKVLYDKVTCRACEADNPLTVEQAKELLGWQQAPEGTKGRFKDRNGDRIICTNTVIRQRPFSSGLAKLWMSEILGRPGQGINSISSLGGNWQLSGESMVVGRTGLLTEGQHRLIGLIWAAQEWAKDPKRYPGWKAEPVLCCIIVYGISEAPEVVNVTNTGKPRDLGDALYAAGLFGKDDHRKRVILTRLTKHAVNLIWSRTGGGVGAFIPRRTHAISLDFIERHSKLLDAVVHIHEENMEKRLSQFQTPGYCAGLLYLMATARTDPKEYRASDISNEDQLDLGLWDKACDFWACLAGGDSALGPIGAYIDKLMAQRGSDLSKDERSGILVNAWNCYSQAKAVTPNTVKLDFTTDQDGIAVLAEYPSVGGIDYGDPNEAKEPIGDEPTPQEIKRRAKTARADRKQQDKPSAKTRKPKPTKDNGLVGKLYWVKDQDNEAWRGKVIEVLGSNARLKVAQGFQGAGSIRAVQVTHLQAKQPR